MDAVTNLTQRLHNNGGKFLVGKNLSYADITTLSAINTVKKGCFYEHAI